MPAPLLELKDVSKRYAASGDANGVNVLVGVSLAVASGETLAIVGPSGSGKSTLLQIIGTLDRATSGEVLLDGKISPRLTTCKSPRSATGNWALSSKRITCCRNAR